MFAGFTEPVVRGVCRVLPLTLSRYHDSSSQSLVHELIEQLIVTHGQATLKYLVPTVAEVAASFRNVVAS